MKLFALLIGRSAAASQQREPIILDTLPVFLDNLAQALSPNYPRKFATEGTTISQEHGGERARVTNIGPGDVIVEVQLLRDLIIQTLSRKLGRPLTDKELGVIVTSIDTSMSESLTAYFMVHQGIREQFTLMLSHDLKTPLSAILSTAQLLIKHPDNATQAVKLGERLVDVARRMNQMIDDMLDASKVRFGERLNFEVHHCEISVLIGEVMQQLAIVHGNRFEYIGPVVEGYWNAKQLQRAIENLLTNAIKYGDPKSPIKVKTARMDGRIIVSVHNEGPVIPKEEQETLFMAFIRAKAAQRGKRTGWGLGLALVRGVAEGHGGSVTIDSAVERGTTFGIDIPIDARPFQFSRVTPGQ